MKRTHLIFLTIGTLAGLGGWAGTLTAQNSTPAKTAAINYNFDTSALDRSNQGLLASYSDMLDKVTPGVVGVYPSSKINPDDLHGPAPAQGTGTGGRRGGGRRGGGGGTGGGGGLGGFGGAADSAPAVGSALVVVATKRSNSRPISRTGRTATPLIIG